jgi:surface antigen
METFTPRTEAPATSNAYFYADNPFYQSGYGMPNCTAYAWGRFWEISGERPRLSTGDAEDWWDYDADGYERGQTAKLGAVICWAKGIPGDDSDGAGHVAVVEKINADGSILTSNSAWNSTLFYEKLIQSDYELAGYTFQGFIYNPVSFNADDGAVSKGDVTSGNFYLTKSQMQKNARYIYAYLRAQGWTLEAIAAMLGNMEAESTINPGIWESLDAGNTNGGFGLVQWTPATKFFDWCEENNLSPTDIDANLQRILYEVENRVQWIATAAHDMTFQEFTQSTAAVETLAKAFLLNYERPGDQSESVQEYRAELARYWYDYLMGSGGVIIPTIRRKRGFNFVLFGRKQWR